MIYNTQKFGVMYRKIFFYQSKAFLVEKIK